MPPFSRYLRAPLFWAIALVAAGLHGCGGGLPKYLGEGKYAPGPPVKLGVAGPASTTNAREVQPITIAAIDVVGDQVSWNGKVHVSSTDPAAIITPVDVTLTGGLGSVQVTFETLGTQSLTVTDIGGNLKSATATTLVTAAPSLNITSGALPGGTVGIPYSGHLEIVCIDCTPGGGVDYEPETVNSFVLTSSGGIEDSKVSWNWSAQVGSSLPPGLSIQPTPACCGSAIVGAPTQAGTYQVTITASDSGLPPAQASADYTLVIGAAQPPTVSTVPGPQGATLNQNYSYDFIVSGIQPITVAETGTLPPGLALSSEGHLGGTPTVAGSYPISVTATDGLGQQSVQSFTVQVLQHGFTISAPLANARFAHTATLLSDGRIFVMGGWVQNASGTYVLSEVPELYDPIAQTVQPGPTATPISNQTATLLCDLSHPPCNNPLVLIAGGSSSFSFDTFYDPTTNTFTQGANEIFDYHMNGTATLLPDGEVLIAGGETDTAEVFDSASKSFERPALTMSTQRTGHTATLLANGKVLITGGYAASAAYAAPGPVLSSTEIYDPSTKTLTAAGNLTEPRANHTATLLADGRILIAGGFNSSGPLSTAELYDPATGLFTRTGDLVTPRAGHTAVLLPDGSVLLVGGQCLNTVLRHAELFDPASGTFSNTGSMQVPRILHTMTELSTPGEVEVIGGTDTDAGHSLSSTELYQ